MVSRHNAAESYRVSESAFHLRYEGDAVAQGLMDVSQAAPSLLAIGRLCERLGNYAYGGQCKVKVELSAQIRQGSWEGLLYVTIPTAAAILGEGPSAEAIIEWAQKLLDLFRRKAESEQKPTFEIRDNQTHITIENLTVAFPNAVANAVADKSVNKSVQEIVRPVAAGHGIEAVSLRRRDEEEGVRIESAAASKMLGAGAIELPGVQVSEISMDSWLIVGKAALEHDLHWDVRLGEGRPLVSMRVLDEDFLARVAANEITFGGGTVISAKVTATQTLYPDASLELSDYRIVEVVEVRHRPNQGALFDQDTRPG